MALSRERIADELLKLLACEAPTGAIGQMLARGIMKPVLPEITVDGQSRLERLIQTEAAAGIASDPIRRLAALIPPQAAEEIGARLKLSNNQRKRLAAAVSGDLMDPHELAYRLGAESAVDRLLLASQADAAAMVARWTPPRLPISGGALVKRGLDAGPIVAQALKMVEDRWVAESFPDSSRVAELADQVALMLRDQNSKAASASSGAA
jgi:poly(A) polymerase